MKKTKKTPPDIDVSRETFTFHLQNSFDILSLKYTPQDLNSFYHFYQHYLKWNITHNLSTIVNFKDFIEKHIIDSLLIFKTNICFTENSVADFGCGGGFPGIPISLFDKNINLLLVDKVKKKTSFLIYLKSVLNIKNIAVENNSFFNLKNTFDIILLRAVTSDPLIITNISDKLSKNGIIVLYQSDKQNFSSDNFNIQSFYFPDNNRNILLLKPLF